MRAGAVDGSAAECRGLLSTRYGHSSAPQCCCAVVERGLAPLPLIFCNVDEGLALRRSQARALAGASCLRHDKELSRSRASNFLLNGARESHQRERHPTATPSGHPALQVRARRPLVGGRTSMCVRRQAASMRPPFGLFAPTDHRRSGAPLKRSALQARRSTSQSSRSSARRSATQYREAVGCGSRLTAFDLLC